MSQPYISTNLGLQHAALLPMYFLPVIAVHITLVILYSQRLQIAWVESDDITLFGNLQSPRKHSYLEMRILWQRWFFLWGLQFLGKLSAYTYLNTTDMEIFSCFSKTCLSFIFPNIFSISVFTLFFTKFLQGRTTASSVQTFRSFPRNRRWCFNYYSRIQ